MYTSVMGVGLPGLHSSVFLNLSILLYLIFTKWVNIYHLFVDKRTIFSEIVKSNGKLHMCISKMIGKIQ